MKCLNKVGTGIDALHKLALSNWLLVEKLSLSLSQPSIYALTASLNTLIPGTCEWSWAYTALALGETTQMPSLHPGPILSSLCHNPRRIFLPLP